MSEPTVPAAARRLRIRHFARAKAEGSRITALTAYDALTAQVFDEAGIDLLLVGDSAANVVYGYDTTLPITEAELVPLAAAVVRGAKRALVVVDLPFGSYERDAGQALDTAVRFLKQTGAQAVKLEGGVRSAEAIRTIVAAGIPVVGHIGYTPQSEHGLGGHVVQGRGIQAAEQLRADARAVADAGAFAVVLELVPAALAAEITSGLPIPTIGIGAGAGTDGQVLVWQDALGLSSGQPPRFVRRFGEVRRALLDGAVAYRDAVADGSYPAASESFDDPQAVASSAGGAA